jgi:hypothetical protein
MGSIVSRMVCASASLSSRLLAHRSASDDHHLGRDPLAEGDGAVHALLDRTHQGLHLHRRRCGLGLLDALDLGLQVGFHLADVLHASPRQPLHQDADTAVRQLQHAHDHRRGADLEQVSLTRVVHRGVALRHQHDDAALRQRPVDRQHALVPSHRKRQDDVREDDSVLQRQDG